MHRLLSRTVLIGMLLIIAAAAAACAGLPPLAAGTPTVVVSTTEPATSVPATAATPTALTSGTAMPGSLPIADSAKQALARQLGVNVADIRVVSLSQVDWPNGCLGIETPGIMCTDAIVPGYQVILEVNGKQYEVRTDLTGQRAVAAAEGVGEDAQPGAAARARERAAIDLGLELGLVRIISVEQVEWPDPCLGVPDPLELCAQVITPGYRVTVEANGQQYVYHTDATGQNIRRERTPTSETPSSVTGTPTSAGQSSGGTSEAVIGLRRDVDGTCTDVRIDLQGVSFGACGSEMVATGFLTTTNRLEQLIDMQRTYSSFGVSTPGGKVTFLGKGPIEASPIEQRMVAEWANLVALETRVAARTVQHGYEWHREGGIAGFCDDVRVEAGGHATYTSCAQGAAVSGVAPSWRRLTTGELTQLYGWLDQLGAVQAEQKDPATADQMTVRVNFAGRGQAQGTDADKNAMLQFGTALLQQWAEPTPVRYVSSLAEVNMRSGPSEQFDVIEKIAAGQQALVTGISRDQAWWRVICPDSTVGNCWVSADPTLTQPIAPAGSTGLQPGAEGQAAIDETQILAAVIRRVYTVDDTFGGNSKLPLIYLLSVDDAGGNNGGGNAIPYSSPARPLPAPVQEGVVAALNDLPAQFKWVQSAGEVKRDQTNAVEGNGAIITVGQVRRQPDGTVRVSSSIYIGPLAAGGQTYILENQGGEWKVTGTTGVQWIS